MSKTPTPRPEVAREFYTNIIMLGELALDNYMAEVRRGEHAMNFTEVREMRMNINVLKEELKKVS